MTLEAVLIMRLRSKDWRFDVILEPSDLGLDGCDLRGTLRELYFYNKKVVNFVKKKC